MRTMVKLALAAWLLGGCGTHTVATGDDADLSSDADLGSDADARPDGLPDADARPDGDADGDVEYDGCIPQCRGRQCGPDGCGGTCGPGCPESQACNEAMGECVSPGDFVHIPAGTFMMGAPEDEVGNWYGETQHQVTLTHDFLLMSTEVTFGDLWSALGETVTPYRCYDHERNLICQPEWVAMNIYRNDAIEFCNFLSEAEGLPPCYEKLFEINHEDDSRIYFYLPSEEYETPYDCPGYRLPTEAEWEYAARAGTTTATYNGDLDPDDLSCHDLPIEVLEPITWYCDQAPFGDGYYYLPASKRPNAWGLWDMIGGACEPVHDGYARDLGAGAQLDPVIPYERHSYTVRSLGQQLVSQTRAAARNFGPCRAQGFRCARTLF